MTPSNKFGRLFYMISFLLFSQCKNLHDGAQVQRQDREFKGVGLTFKAKGTASPAHTVSCDSAYQTGSAHKIQSQTEETG